VSLSDASPRTEPFRILTVCTGNICRSPAVERLLRAGFDGTDVEVTSAGTRAVVGHAISGPMVPLITGAGAPSDDFAARQLTSALVRQADLVLALTRTHRSAVVELLPGAVRRTFTLLELARLAALVDRDDLPSGSPGERFAALLPLAAARRGQQAVRATDDDVADPYGLGDAAYASSFAAMEPAVRAIVDVVRG
jgi:protein-tyrosine phosphatase